MAETEKAFCPYSGLGLYAPLPSNKRVFWANCECGKRVVIMDGRIPFHRQEDVTTTSDHEGGKASE